MKITEQGYAVVEGDTHIGQWVHESQRLDHDATVRDFIVPLLEPHFHIVDGGANIGTHTLLYAQAAHGGKVHAFEPNQDAFDCLVHNVRNCTNVTCCKWGLSNGIEECELMASQNVGAGYLQRKKHGAITCIPLDALNLQQLHFLKLDIEGYELWALEGAKTTISLHRPKVLVEMNRGTLGRNGVSYEDIFQFLDSMEYEWKPLTHDNQLADAQYDLLATPKTTTA